MPSQIRPTRQEVNDRFPMLGFTITTDGEDKRYEVVIASDAALFRPDKKPNRTRSTFYSSRAAGLQPIERGEAVYVLPPEVLSRFAGQQKLYYVLATYSDGKTTSAEFTPLPSEGSAYVNVKGLTGRTLSRVRILPSRQRAAAGYANGSGSDMEWGGDVAMPGTQPVNGGTPSSPAPAVSSTQPTASTPPAPGTSQGLSADAHYDDGYDKSLWSRQQAAGGGVARGHSAAVQARARSLAGDYDVPLVPQPDKHSCWAASMAMLLGFRRRQNISPESLAQEVGRSLRTSYGWDMLEAVKDHFGFREIALPSDASLYYSPEQWQQWLNDYGPLWVTTVGVPSHAIIVSGLSGDLTPQGTTVSILNPWDTTQRFDSDEIDFHPSNPGRAYTQSFGDFSADFGNLGLGDYGNWRVLYLPVGAATSQGLGATGPGGASVPTRQIGAHSMAVDYEVMLIPQPDKFSCWAASMAMLLGFRRRQSIPPETLAQEVGRNLRTCYGWDMLEAVKDHFGFSDISLPSNASLYYTPEQWQQWLNAYGPLWVTTVGTPSHAIVVSGLSGDLTPQGTTVRILNPWDTTQSFDSDQVDFHPYNPGRAYTQSFADFSADFGNLGLGNYGEWRVLYLPVSAAASQGMSYGDVRTGRAQEVSGDDGGGIEEPIPAADAEAASAQAYTRALGDPPDYPQASRFAPAASVNYRTSSGQRAINRVVVHITDGGSRISGTIGWFQNPNQLNSRGNPIHVSAHYVVGQDGEVVQMVRNNDVAWHASSANSDSIGIEHVANTHGLVPTDAQYCGSAALVRWLCDTYGIPIDRTHVLGHSEADPRTTHTDCPNAVWDWDHFMRLVETASRRPRAQSQGLSTNGGITLPTPPPPIPRVRAMGAGVEITSTIVGAVMERILNNEGDITWSLDQLRGLKHPHDVPPTPSAGFHDAPAIRLDDWPLVENRLTDQISAWFKVDWQFNGQSLGNVRIANVGTNDAVGWGLSVEARIMDDNILYGPASPPCAALRITFNYRFTRSIGSDLIATAELHLFGDGTFEKTGSWEQH